MSIKMILRLFTNIHNIAAQRHFDAPLYVGVFATVAML